MNRSRQVFVVGVAAVLALLVGLDRLPVEGRGPAGEVDFEKAHDETVDTLQKLIRYDTTNPPGNELELCRAVEGWLEAEGIAAEAIEPAPGRGDLIARLKGDGSRKPILIVAHIDVVGIEEGKWTVDPFEGLVKDGYLWGRGAIDDKGMAACAIQVLRMLAREKRPLKRDVILALTCDEESGGEYGVKWLIENRREEIDAEFGLNEGGKIMTRDDGSILYFGVQNAEKQYFDVQLVAKGTSGHGSIPRPDNPIHALARALKKIEDHPTPVELNETTRRFFLGQAKVREEPLAGAMRTVADVGAEPAARAAAARTVGEFDPVFASMLRTSVAATMLDAGIRENVIPSTATANLNCRLLPGKKIADLAKWLEEIIDDEAVEVVWAERDFPEAPTSSPDGPLFGAIEKVAAGMAPDGVVVPYMSTGATDSARLRRAGIPTYGLVPMPLSDDDYSRLHGNDERVSMKNLRFGVEFLYRLVVEIAE